MYFQHNSISQDLALNTCDLDSPAQEGFSAHSKGVGLSDCFFPITSCTPVAQTLGGGEIYEIDTPNATLTAMKSGVYRVDVFVFPKEDQTWVTVRRGSLAATGNGSSVKVEAGQQVRFKGGNSLQHTAEKAPAPDGFDDWARVRDERLGVFRSGPFLVGFGPYWGPYPSPPPPPYWGPYPYCRQERIYQAGFSRCSPCRREALIQRSVRQRSGLHAVAPRRVARLRLGGL